MKMEKFADLAAAWGSNIDRWPQADQAPARDFLAAHPEAAALLAQEASLEATLAAWTVQAPGAALAGRIATRATPSDLRPWNLRLRGLWRWAAGAGAAATLAGGVMAGMALVTWKLPPPETGISSLYGVRVLGARLNTDHQADNDD